MTAFDRLDQHDRDKSRRVTITDAWPEEQQGDAWEGDHTFNGDGKEPSANGQATTATWPGPMGDEAYRGVLGAIVRAIEPHSEAHPIALLAQLLAGVGNIIGRTAHFKVEGDTHYCNLFMILVGPTAKGRKGTSWGRVRHYLERIDGEWLGNRVLGGLASGEGMIHAVRDPVQRQEPIKGKGGRIEGYQTVVTDEGEPDKRLLCVEEEYATVLRVLQQRDGNTLSARIREAWSGRPIGSLTKSSPTRCREPHISIIGHATVEELRRYLGASEIANGFGNRHLPLCVKRSKCLPDGGGYHDPDSELVRHLQSAVEHARTVGELRRDQRASVLWHRVYPQLSEGKPGLSGAMLGRAEAQVMRLAVLYAVLDLSPVIREDHLQAALTFWDYVEETVGYIWQDSTGDYVADDILVALRQSPAGLTRTEIRDLFGRHKDAARIDKALRLLQESGLATVEKEGTSGRPVERWRVAPKATKATKATLT